jgi:transcriptional regulator with XRE-family HTH domain
VIVVGKWTGQEASALRQALRLTIRDFAEHLGVAERTVAKWEAGGSAMVPVLVMQAALDTVLERLRRGQGQIRDAPGRNLEPCWVCGEHRDAWRQPTGGADASPQ